jgi:hypothetical protein
MAMPSAQDAAARWVQNTSGATERYKAGVQAVTVSPGTLAARSADLWAVNTAAAKNKFAANSAKVSAEAWKAATAGKGADRLASGVQAAQGNYTAALEKLLPYIQTAVSGLPQRGNLEANITRMTSFVRKMSQYNK